MDSRVIMHLAAPARIRNVGEQYKIMIKCQLIVYIHIQKLYSFLIACNCV